MRIRVSTAASRDAVMYMVINAVAPPSHLFMWLHTAAVRLLKHAAWLNELEEDDAERELKILENPSAQFIVSVNDRPNCRNVLRRHTDTNEINIEVFAQFCMRKMKGNKCQILQILFRPSSWFESNDLVKSLFQEKIVTLTILHIRIY